MTTLLTSAANPHFFDPLNPSPDHYLLKKNVSWLELPQEVLSEILDYLEPEKLIQFIELGLQPNAQKRVVEKNSLLWKVLYVACKIFLKKDKETHSLIYFFAKYKPEMRYIDVIGDQLEELCLPYRISLEEMTTIVQKCPNLHSLKYTSHKKLTSSNDPRLFTIEFLKKLSSLTTLELSLNNESSIFKDIPFRDLSLQHLPSNLTSFHLQAETYITNQGLKFLPKTLTSLNLSSCDKISDEGIDDLPKELTSLNISTATLSDPGIRLLPRSLRVLSVSIKTLTPSSCDLLPPELTTLDMSHTNLSIESINQLPRTLRNLKFASHSQLKASVCWPPALLSLHIKTPYLYDVDISLLPKSLHTLYVFSQKTLTKGCIEKLPPLLTSLHLGLITDMSAEHVSCLPQTLTSLQFSSTQKIDFNLIKWPLSLKTLILSNKEMEDIDIPFLPQTLIKLILSSEKLTDRSISSLPRRLQVLSLSSSLITDQSAPDFPRRLTTLSLFLNNQLTFGCLSKLPKSLTYLYLPSNQSSLEYAYQFPHLKIVTKNAIEREKERKRSPSSFYQKQWKKNQLNQTKQ